MRRELLSVRQAKPGQRVWKQRAEKRARQPEPTRPAEASFELVQLKDAAVREVGDLGE